MEELKKFQAVLFDLDGVLVDSIKAWFSAFNDTLERFGEPKLTMEEFAEECWGTEVEQNLHRLGLGEEAVEYCKSKFIDHMDEIEIFPEAEKILASIDVKVGLVTSTPSEQTSKLLEHFGLRGYFDVIVAGDDVENPKPAAEPVEKACRLLDVLPQEAVFVGDNESDVEAGEKAGCTVVGIGVEGDLKLEKLSELWGIL